ncbi:phosphatidylinositol 4-kinase gamma 4 [Striga asiatica]|uniref:1-phosphatidylinositol 4-kinase n=1 Tax=Striga asiatica TaxID=4170 RepID=A0A5A7PNU0_STRAF|nr:phosphatidylinositol 4-kinase gamma 4 [Striga asiatica]
MSVASVALSPVYDDYWNFPGRVSGQHGPWSNDSILIYLTVGGSVIPMRVLESDSIASVKLRIQKCKGFFARKQKLVFEGKELARNSSPVRDYGVADGKVLHLVLRFSDLQSITVRTVCGKEFEFQVQRKSNVGHVKRQIAEKGDGFFNLKDQELFCDGEELDDQRIIDDLCRSNDAVIHFLVRKSAKLRAVPVEKDFEVSIIALDAENKADKKTWAGKGPIIAVPRRKDFLLEPLNINPKVIMSPVLKKLIEDTFRGLEMGHRPVRSSEGSGGAYFMQDSSGQNYVSVFKPIDEEPMAVNNPRGLPLSTNGEGLKRGTRVGEGAIREVAAYILDERGFSGVPPTVIVKCQHEGFYYSGDFNGGRSGKFGSLQMFVKNCGSCEDVGSRDFPVAEVHKICVLDIRLANADRHAGNILICKDGEDGQMNLIPIDHGYCLPENFEDCTFEWLYWPQSRKPFSPDEISYINSLDAEKDIQLLKFHGWNIPEECVRVLRISTMLLKKGANRGLTPYEIGSIMCRETVKKESVIEKMVKEAEKSVLPGTGESAFLESISTVMDHYLPNFRVNSY